jgi:hypothetical protein
MGTWDPHQLEDIWRQRVQNALQRYKAAQEACQKSLHERGDMPSPDGFFAFQQALRAETAALNVYMRVRGSITASTPTATWAWTLASHSQRPGPEFMRFQRRNVALERSYQDVWEQLERAHAADSPSAGAYSEPASADLTPAPANPTPVEPHPPSPSARAPQWPRNPLKTQRKPQNWVRS